MKQVFLLCSALVLCLVVKKYIGIFIITSNSMSPTICAGDIVITIQKAAYYAGDIITFHTPDSHRITHRVMGKSRYSYITKGDGNKTVDTYIIHDEHINGAVAIIIHTSIFFSKSRNS